MNYKIRTDNIKEDFTKELFSSRGIDIQDIQKFLKTSDNDIIDYNKLDNIEKGAQLLNFHLKNNSKILIVVDCDVDGLTSSAILWNYIKKIDYKSNLEYIMHDGKEHGLSNDIYETVYDRKYDLIILPDASSNDYNQHKELNSSGTSILILDHHDAPHYSEYAITINNQLSVDYTNKSLSGAGIVWQFIRFYNNYYNLTVNIEDFLDLVALGNVADVMDLRSIETKHLITKGLSNLKNSLFKTACKEQAYSMKDKITPMSVAWYIGPLLNAMIRVGSQRDKELTFEALLDENQGKKVPSTKRGHQAGDMEILQNHVVRICKNTRTKQNNIVDESMAFIEKKIAEKKLTDNKILIIKIEQDKIPSELVGLVANKIASKYQQPTIILREYEDELRGSIRNFSNSPIEDFRKELEDSELIIFAQGHASAAGVGLKKDNLVKLINYFNNKWKDLTFDPVYSVDYEFNLLKDEMYLDIEESKKLRECIMSIGSLNDLGIWGQGIEEPLIVVKNISVDKIQLVSPDKKPTLKITVGDITIMKFNSSLQEYEELKGSGFKVNTIDLIGTCNINEWCGRITPQILINEYKIVSNNKYYF